MSEVHNLHEDDLTTIILPNVWYFGNVKTQAASAPDAPEEIADRFLSHYWESRDKISRDQVIRIVKRLLGMGQRKATEYVYGLKWRSG